MTENVETIRNSDKKSVLAIKQIMFEMQLEILKETDATPEDMVSAIIGSLVDFVGAYEEVVDYSITRESLGHLRYHLEKMEKTKEEHRDEIEEMKKDMGF
jgi:hypothetical protein